MIPAMLKTCAKSSSATTIATVTKNLVRFLIRRLTLMPSTTRSSILCPRWTTPSKLVILVAFARYFFERTTRIVNTNKANAINANMFFSFEFSHLGENSIKRLNIPSEQYFETVLYLSFLFPKALLTIERVIT